MVHETISFQHRDTQIMGKVWVEYRNPTQINRYCKRQVLWKHIKKSKWRQYGSPLLHISVGYRHMQVDLYTELALKITLPLMQTYKNSGHLLAHFVKQPCET